LSDIIQYFNVKDRREGRGRGMTVGRSGKRNEKEISEKRIMKMNLLKRYK
jgi:hypothetical protein